MGLEYTRSVGHGNRSVMLEDTRSNDISIAIANDDEVCVSTYAENDGSDVIYEWINKRELIKLISDICIDLDIADDVRTWILNEQIAKSIKRTEELQNEAE